MQFEPLFENNNEQAYGCASDIFMNNGSLHLLGHYGSTVADGDLYKVTGGNYKVGIICDECINDGLQESHFEYVNGVNYFGFKEPL